MITLEQIKDYLKNYSGRPLRLMEVCGTHTAEISRNGIRSLLSPNIRLISGPGCPVCVTVTSYIDRLVELALTPGYTVATFGDMLRVPGGRLCLNEAKAMGGSVRMVYSPMDLIALAQQSPKTTFVFAAVGFETTAPVYAELLETAWKKRIFNLRLLTSLKTMPPVIRWVCENRKEIDGFLAPGHVSVVTGSNIFQPLAEKYTIPFAVAGFTGSELLSAIYALVRLQGQGRAVNLYSYAVSPQGNLTAQQAVNKYFVSCPAAWRGIGLLPESGLKLRPEYQLFDAGGADLTLDEGFQTGCRCADILTGNALPTECPLFGTVCTPQSPKGACMVSSEGSCHHYYLVP